MNNINYINDNTLIIINYEYFDNYIEYDTSILKLIDRIYINNDNNEFPSKVEYIFLILQKYKPTKIKFIENHTTSIIEINIKNKMSSKCIII